MILKIPNSFLVVENNLMRFRRPGEEVHHYVLSEDEANELKTVEWEVPGWMELGLYILVIAMALGGAY